jgi:hypothetical protein
MRHVQLPAALAACMLACGCSTEPGTHVNWSKYRAIGFDYPPENIIVDVRRFAQQHGLYMYFNFVMEE